MADCAEIKTRLDAARLAWDRLMNGGQVRVVQDSDGSRIEYSVANPGKLQAYLALLEAQYAGCLAGTSPVATRPLQYFF